MTNKLVAQNDVDYVIVSIVLMSNGSVAENQMSVRLFIGWKRGESW